MILVCQIGVKLSVMIRIFIQLPVLVCCRLLQFGQSVGKTFQFVFASQDQLAQMVSFLFLSLAQI